MPLTLPDRVKRLRACGYTVKGISDLLGITQQRVREICYVPPVARRQQHRESNPSTAELRRGAAEMLEAGADPKIVAAVFGDWQTDGRTTNGRPKQQ